MQSFTSVDRHLSIFHYLDATLVITACLPTVNPLIVDGLQLLFRTISQPPPPNLNYEMLCKQPKHTKSN